MQSKHAGRPCSLRVPTSQLLASAGAMKTRSERKRERRRDTLHRRSASFCQYNLKCTGPCRHADTVCSQLYATECRMCRPRRPEGIDPIQILDATSAHLVDVHKEERASLCKRSASRTNWIRDRERRRVGGDDSRFCSLSLSESILLIRGRLSSFVSL